MAGSDKGMAGGEQMIYTDGVHLISDQGPEELHPEAKEMCHKNERLQMDSNKSRNARTK